MNYTPATEHLPQGTAELEFASEPHFRRIPAQQLPGWVQVDSSIFQNADEQPLWASLAVASRSQATESSVARSGNVARTSSSNHLHEKYPPGV